MNNLRTNKASRISLVVLHLMMVIPYGKFQEDEGTVQDVTLEMYAVLQGEVNILNANMNDLKGQLDTLAARLESLQATSGAATTVELLELQALIDISKRQDEDIARLYYINGLWQQNFKAINKTFERLRNVVVFSIPILNNPLIPAATNRRALPIQQRSNITISSSSPKQTP